MPRFFFNVINGVTTPDEDGSDLPNLAAARHAASDILAEQLRNSREAFWKMGRWRLEITDANGTVLAVIALTMESTA